MKRLHLSNSQMLLDILHGTQLIAEALQAEHDGYFDAGRFREAEILIDFLYYLDSAKPEIQAQRKETQELMRVEKEIRKMQREGIVFPPITFCAMKWFYRDYWPPEEIEYLGMEFPFLDSEAGENLEIDEMFALGLSLYAKNILCFTGIFRTIGMNYLLNGSRISIARCAGR